MKKILFLLPLILALLVSGTVEAKKKKYPNGDYYEGEWKKGTPNGSGKMIYANGNIYIGQWSLGEIEGQGSMTYKNGDYYEGEWKKGMPNGSGKMTYANGNIYMGQWALGKSEGRGIMIYANDNRYEGEWKQGVPDGKGVMTNANGDVYEGTWLGGETLNGVGSIKYANGNIFHGEWEQHQPVRGKMVYVDGSVYNGTWQNGILYNGTSQGGNMDEGFYNGKWVAGNFYEGNCQGYIADSLWYDGEFKEGKMTNGRCNGYITDLLWYNGELKDGKKIKGKGKGYINGNYYDGEWINDFFIGNFKFKNINKDIASVEGTIFADSMMKGKILYKNGNLYKGELKNYLREGKGRMSLDGIVMSGVWKKDTLIHGTGNIKNMAESYSFSINKVSNNYDIQIKNIFGYQIQLRNITISTDEDLTLKVQDIIKNQLAQQTIQQRQIERIEKEYKSFDIASHIWTTSDIRRLYEENPLKCRNIVGSAPIILVGRIVDITLNRIYLQNDIILTEFDQDDKDVINLQKGQLIYAFTDIRSVEYGSIIFESPRTTGNQMHFWTVVKPNLNGLKPSITRYDNENKKYVFEHLVKNIYR